MVIVDESFISNIYKNLQPIFYGTLYILDKRNKILSKNHPCSDNFFKFDENKKDILLKIMDIMIVLMI